MLGASCNEGIRVFADALPATNASPRGSHASDGKRLSYKPSRASAQYAGFLKARQQHRPLLTVCYDERAFECPQPRPRGRPREAPHAESCRPLVGATTTIANTRLGSPGLSTTGPSATGPSANLSAKRLTTTQTQCSI